MSSAMVLQNMETKGLSEFSFTWSVHNFSYCHFDKDLTTHIGSPDFQIQFIKDNKSWWIKLFPKGHGEEGRGFISCYLSSEYKTRTDFQFTISIQSATGQIKKGDVKNFDTSSEKEQGYRKLISLEELKGPGNYLANDTLIMHLHAWKTDADNPTSLRGYAHSQIKATKLDYTWVLKDFEVSDQTFKFNSAYKADVSEFFSDNLFPHIRISVVDGYCRGGLDKDSIYFGVRMKNVGKEHFWVARIHVLGADGKVVHSAYGEHLFTRNTSDPEHFYIPIISKYKLCSNTNLYLSGKTLTLQCELGYSTRTKLKTFKFQTPDYLEWKPDTADQVVKDQKVWADKIMMQSRDDRKFSDFVIRTPDETFPVHRLILSAQSEVFAAMFERDMKEKKTGEVEINDLDNDTISKMLQFLYTARIDDMDYSLAKKLYYAADKYRIVALQNRCSGYLLRCLSTSNVCAILDLADKHQDQILKSYARDFIEVNAQDVIDSASWKKLAETNIN